MKKHIEVVGGIFIRKGKVLASMRGESKYAYVAHKYEFVGGKIDAGETPEQALTRELCEEMGAKIEVISHYMTVTHEYPDFIVTLQTYLCRFLSDFQVLEHERADFLRGDELDENNWAPADAPISALTPRNPAPDAPIMPSASGA